MANRFGDEIAFQTNHKNHSNQNFLRHNLLFIRQKPAERESFFFAENSSYVWPLKEIKMSVRPFVASSKSRGTASQVSVIFGFLNLTSSFFKLQP
jgi:hypothetical protein